jgi:protein TonB
LLSFLEKRLRYPEIARENGVEGMVVVQFTMEKDGQITHIDMLRDIGNGCGQEAKRLFDSCLRGCQRRMQMSQYVHGLACRCALH